MLNDFLNSFWFKFANRQLMSRRLSRIQYSTSAKKSVVQWKRPMSRSLGETKSTSKRTFWRNQIWTIRTKIQKNIDDEPCMKHIEPQWIWTIYETWSETLWWSDNQSNSKSSGLEDASSMSRYVKHFKAILERLQIASQCHDHWGVLGTAAPGWELPRFRRRFMSIHSNFKKASGA